MEAVRVPPSAWRTSQSIQRVLPGNFLRLKTARSARPMRRWISMDLPSIFPRVESRCLRSRQEYGSIEYSEVIQPPSTFWCLIQAGTLFSMVAAQITWVLPNEMRTEPDALGAILGWKEMFLSSLGFL